MSTVTFLVLSAAAQYARMWAQTRHCHCHCRYETSLHVAVHTLVGAHMYRLQLSHAVRGSLEFKGEQDGAEAKAKRARTGIGCRDRSFGPFDPSPTHQSLVW